MSDAKEQLLQKIKDAPKAPGCYLFKDSKGMVMYVGKAKNLNNRVKQYFRGSPNDDDKTKRLARFACDVEYAKTNTELDALLLEFHLIRLHKPWYNTQLKSDVEHPYLKIAQCGTYATISIDYNYKPSAGIQYFGSFRNDYDIRETIEDLSVALCTPRCGQGAFSSRAHPCIFHDTGACMAPCAGIADPNEYAKALREATRILNGKPPSGVKALERQMREYADAMDYESAETCRRKLLALERLSYRSKRLLNLPSDRSVLAALRAYRSEHTAIFYIKNGVALCRADFDGPPRDAALDGFLAQIDSGEITQPPWMAEGLTEIYAQKAFSILPKRHDAARIRKEAVRLASIFNNPSDGNAPP